MTLWIRDGFFSPLTTRPQSLLFMFSVFDKQILPRYLLGVPVDHAMVRTSTRVTQDAVDDRRPPRRFVDLFDFTQEPNVLLVIEVGMDFAITVGSLSPGGRAGWTIVSTSDHDTNTLRDLRGILPYRLATEKRGPCAVG